MRGEDNTGRTGLHSVRWQFEVNKCGRDELISSFPYEALVVDSGKIAAS